jgi:hypothetical protein
VAGGLIGLEEHPRGRRAVLRSTVGVAFVMGAGTIAWIVLLLGLSAPLFYLRWW